MGRRPPGQEEGDGILTAQHLCDEWQAAFIQILRQHENATPLREAAHQENLGDWTKSLTDAVVKTCGSMGWQASSKGHRLRSLPVRRNEYLSLDLMAFSFSDGESGWKFPTAVMELENNLNDEVIAYSLWKLLCVRTDLRVVFCYRRRSEEGSSLIRYLGKEVVGALDLEDRSDLKGETMVVVGSRDDSMIFPHGFFKWWRLDNNTGTFRII